MATLTVSLSLGTVNHPPGTALGKFRTRLGQPGYPNKEQLFDLPIPLSVTFADVQPGPWTFTAVQLNSSNTMIGSVFTLTGDVPAPQPVPGPVVTGASATVA
jgi:hypothetical protein